MLERIKELFTHTKDTVVEKVTELPEVKAAVAESDEHLEALKDSDEVEVEDTASPQLGTLDADETKEVTEESEDDAPELPEVTPSVAVENK